MQDNTLNSEQARFVFAAEIEAAQADVANKDAVEASDSKHTPGPWTSSHGRWVKANKGTIATCHNQWNVTDELLSDQEVGANARLMAAAPELLDLAREAAEVGETIAALACAPDGSYRVPCAATKAELVSIITDLGTKAAALINNATKGEA